MKKYNLFKLVCIDNEKINKDDVVELKVEGEYLVGSLYHLSTYDLVAKNLKNEDTKTADNSITNKSNNPTTGDVIYVAIVIFALAGIGLFVTIYLNKKNKTRKH